MPEKRDWFQVIEIEVNRLCNLSCKYCPQGKKSMRVKEETYMPFLLFKRIIDMLADINYSGRLSFHHYNEPLLRSDLDKLVEYARKSVPSAYFVLYTNGVFLDDNRYHDLLNAGIDYFFITNHNNITLPERKYQLIRRPGEFFLSGRAGLIDSVESPMTLPCYAPSEMFIVRYDGGVVLCHEDAEAQHIMGSLKEETLEDIWFSETFEEKRRLLEKGQRAEAGGICAVCDNRLHPLPDTAI